MIVASAERISINFRLMKHQTEINRNYQRSTMRDAMLSGLTMFSLENEKARSLDREEL